MSIRVEHLTKTLRGTDVLQDVSLEASNGMVTGLQGTNGSGKTMLMRAVCGLIRPSSGRVILDNQVLGEEIAFPPSLGMLIEAPAFLNHLTGYDNLMLLADIRGLIGPHEVSQVMLDVGLNPYEPKKYRAYSLGMKQRLGIAAAVMEQPDIVVLDEPTNALDSSGVSMLKRMIRAQRERGATVLISCHDAAVLAELSDTIYRIVDGRIEGQEVIHA